MRFANLMLGCLLTALLLGPLLLFLAYMANMLLSVLPPP